MQAKIEVDPAKIRILAEALRREVGLTTGGRIELEFDENMQFRGHWTHAKHPAPPRPSAQRQPRLRSR